MTTEKNEKEANDNNARAEPEDRKERAGAARPGVLTSDEMRRWRPGMNRVLHGRMWAR